MNSAKSAYNDQFNAAVSDVHRHLRSYAEHTGSTVTRSDAAWIKNKFEEFALNLMSDKGQRCPHIGPSPMVAHTAAWATHWLVCPACIDRIQPSPDEDRRCDRCGQISQTLHAGTAAHGPVLMTYGLCTTCSVAAGPQAG